MGDAWLIIAVFVFAFILWFSTGGPTRPISFAGPYITPITTTGDVQSAYGDQVSTGSGSGVWGVKSVLGTFGANPGAVTTDPGVVSPSRGRVTIASGAGGPSASNPNQEYVTLRASNDGPINITGWQLVSTKSGASAAIPQATIAPRENGAGALTNVVLAPGGEAVVTTGSSPLNQSFRENMCTGYLNNGSIVPSLSTRSCPTPTSELGSFYTGSAASYDACRQSVSRLPICSSVNSAPADTSPECENFINAHLNYAGCVNSHFNDAGYAGTTWRVYLNQNHELWRSDNESIRLLDAQGRTVDIYSY